MFRLILSLDLLRNVETFFEKGRTNSLGGGDSPVRAKELSINSLAAYGDRGVEKLQDWIVRRYQTGSRGVLHKRREPLSRGYLVRLMMKRLNESIFRKSSKRGLSSVCLSLSFIVRATSCLRMLTSRSCIGMSSGEMTERDPSNSRRIASMNERRQRSVFATIRWVSDGFDLTWKDIPQSLSCLSSNFIMAFG